jgi:hypothetical protein
MAELYQINRIKELENQSKWWEAAQGWMDLGRQDEANACITIAYAVERGDSYRAEVLRVAGPEPEVEGDKQDSIKWMAWFKKMEEVYRTFNK